MFAVKWCVAHPRKRAHFSRFVVLVFGTRQFPLYIYPSGLLNCLGTLITIALGFLIDPVAYFQMSKINSPGINWNLQHPTKFWKFEIAPHIFTDVFIFILNYLTDTYTEMLAFSDSLNGWRCKLDDSQILLLNFWGDTHFVYFSASNTVRYLTVSHMFVSHTWFCIPCVRFESWCGNISALYCSCHCISPFATQCHGGLCYNINDRPLKEFPMQLWIESRVRCFRLH